MKLREYESKSIFKKYGISIPRGIVLSSPKKIKLDSDCVVKAQVLSGKRKKNRGIRIVRCSEAPDACRMMLKSIINKEKVEKVLVEEKLDIRREMYLAITIDRFNQRYALVFSEKGGTGIEETAKKDKNIIKKMNFFKLDKEKAADALGNTKTADIAERLWKIVQKENALLAEINPLAETTDGKLIAADAKIILDDNAFQTTERNKGLNYVKLGGNIGIIGNGAGLVMATLDTVKYFGGEPACFLDLGGGTGPDTMQKAMETVLKNPNVKSLLINIFAGITKCDDVAKGIIEYKQKRKITIPILIRMTGTNEESGKKMLEEEGFEAGKDMEESIKKIIEKTK